MYALRAALLSFADDGTARYEEDGLLVVGPDASGRQVIRAAGSHAALARWGARRDRAVAGRQRSPDPALAWTRAPRLRDHAALCTELQRGAVAGRRRARGPPSRRLDPIACGREQGRDPLGARAVSRC